jgi:hypothetical protein
LGKYCLSAIAFAEQGKRKAVEEDDKARRLFWEGYTGGVAAVYTHVWASDMKPKVVTE